MTLTQFGATKREIAALATPMADYLAAHQGVEASQENSVELANKIAQAVSTRKLGRFAREMGITDADQKRWKELHSNFQRMEFLGAQIEKHFHGMAASQGGTVAGQLSRAVAEQKHLEGAISEKFKSIELRWRTLVIKMETAALPILDPFVNAAVKGFDILDAAWSKFFAKISTDRAVFQKWGDLIKQFMGEINWDPSANLQSIETIGTDILATFQKIGEIWEKIDREADRISDNIRMVLGIQAVDPANREKAVDEMREDARRRAAHGGHVGDLPGTFPGDIIGARADEKRSLWENKESTDAVTKSQRRLESSMFDLDSVARSVTNAFEFMTSKMGYFPISGAGGAGTSGVGAGLPDPGETGSGFKVYEQYPWEGHSSNYGPMGIKLGEGYGVGLGPEVMAKYGLHQGDQVHIPGVGWRKINESSARGHGIEFFTKKPGTYTGKGDRMQIDQIRKGANPPAPVGHTINSSPTINIHGPADKSAIASIGDHLRRHTEDLLEMLQRADNEDARRALV